MVQKSASVVDQKTKVWLQSMNALKDGLMKIQKKDSFELSFEQLYRMTYDIVREKKFRELYDAVYELVLNYVHESRNKIHETLKENQLTELIHYWNDHLASAGMFRDVLMFLDQAYVIKENLENVYDMSLGIFKNEVVRYSEISQAISSILCGMVHAERTGVVIDHSIFKSTINMLLTLSNIEGNNIEYKEIFENRYLIESAVFYQQEAQRLLSNPNTETTTYIRNYEARKNDEKERVTKLLHKSTETLIINVLDKCLIKENLNNIIELKNGIRYLLETACREEISILFEWYKKFDKEKEFLDMVLQIYREFGLSIVEKEDIRDADQWKIVKSVLELKEKFENYSKLCFSNNVEFKQNIEENFQMIFNQNPRMAEFLSAYIHETLRKSREFSDEEIDQKLEAFIHLFRILSDKDIFERFYKNHFGKRLLAKPNVEVERKMLTKLKAECGRSFTANLESMLTDLQISSDHMDIFNAEIINNDESLGGVEFYMTVLQSGAWRLQYFPNCNLPPTPSALFALYTTFYNDKHNGRKLCLQANLGSVMLKAYYDQNSFENLERRSAYFFDVSTLQMIILMLFNDHDKLTIEEIQHLTNIPENNLILALNPLVLGKPTHRILKRIGDFPAKSPLAKENVIIINKNFQSKQPRIKFPFQATQSDEINDRKLIQERTSRERGYEIDAAIVRIMKVRKVLPHRDIVSETIQQLKARFKPDVKSIDARIMTLVEREYIAKKENEPNMYLYVT